MTWFWIGLLRLLHGVLSTRTLARMGEAFGALLYRLARTRRHIVDTNLSRCFPEWPAARRAALARDHFRAFGRAMLLETVSWWGSESAVRTLVEIEGGECLEALRGKPIILLAPHFLGLNIGFVRLSLDHAPLTTMYARIKNPRFDRLMYVSRTRFGASRLHSRADGIRGVVTDIRRGLPFYYLPDMDYGRKDAVFVPFFGVPAATITGLPRVARIAGAVVVPAIVTWQGERYVLRLDAPWADYPTDDVVADTARMNAYIEARILDMPAEYFWVHKRFKTRPEGERGFYDA